MKRCLLGIVEECVHAQGGSWCDLQGHTLRHNSSLADRTTERGGGVVHAAAAAAAAVCVCVCEENDDEVGQLERVVKDSMGSLE